MELKSTTELTSDSVKLTNSTCFLKRKRPPIIEIPRFTQQPTIIVSPSSTPEDNGRNCFGGAGFAVQYVKGMKKSMEDAYTILPSSSKAFFGVYDGHGGRNAVDFITENLHRNITAELMKSEASSGVEEAVRSAYHKTDHEFLQKGLVSGACCVTALIENRELVVSNIGDCRAVLCRGGMAEALTRDHTLENDDERRRIENQGGYVEFHRGAWRVHGVLAVSRSIGDSHLKNWVIAEPETRIVPLSPDMKFLLLASDGLWNKIGNQEAVDLVLSCTTNKSYKQLPSSLLDKRLNDSSASVKRSSILKSKKLHNSPKLQTDNICEARDHGVIVDCENLSPQLKSRRILNEERHLKENQDPNKTSGSQKLVLACKKLVNLAINRGCQDDITVILIDLTCFQCSSKCS